MALTTAGRVVVGCALAGITVSGPAAPAAIDALSGRDLPGLVGGLVTLLHLGLSAWVLAVLVVVATGHGIVHGRAGTRRRRMVPRLAFHLVVVGAVGAGAVLPAAAEQSGRGQLDGLMLPDRPSVVAPATLPAESLPTAPTVTVAPGDTLWAIAAARLAPGAPPDRIAAAVVVWHAANHAVIGDDPDLIHPGHRLTVPQELLP
ncbi:hypothetical protein HMPREF0063_11891 [Aeromicrobium marinum DSM 15272]|uniref:LysM domain-containing protein n=1 Tax=Aeromicrobium marinum DSM 15272 TaxID=585531 RepID=E2SDV5_9ACTN|nr:LysM domain-containing protein [Aeromicrobium marinum]EFQ82682.1 hypothetical protein HMPREF0063_11891 [Aeromicrobium marinum DSM 15272]